MVTDAFEKIAPKGEFYFWSGNSKPKSAVGNLSNLLNGAVHFPNVNSLSPPANARLLSIKKTKSYEVKMYVGETKHSFLTELDPMYVVFDSHAGARSFAKLPSAS
jgi:hypothetical protein